MTTHAVRAETTLVEIAEYRRARAFLALLARDFRVLRRSVRGFLIRSITQPLLFVFVFTFVLPRTRGSSGGGSAPVGGGAGGLAFATILLPGLVASALMMQGLISVSTPLVMELSYTREIEDRVMAPVPMWFLGVAKIVSGALQAVVAGAIVIPVVMYVHARGEGPDVDFGNWPMIVIVLVLSALLMASLGLLLGTIVEPAKLSSVFTMVMVPVTMLGCVYYPWIGLHSIPWLKVLVLFNPLVYVSEGLRSVLVPGLPHLATWAIMLVLALGTVVVTATSVYTLSRRLAD